MTGPVVPDGVGAAGVRAHAAANVRQTQALTTAGAQVTCLVFTSFAARCRRSALSSRGLAGGGLRGMATTLTRCRQPLRARETAFHSPNCAPSLSTRDSDLLRVCPESLVQFVSLNAVSTMLDRALQVGRRRQSLAMRVASAGAGRTPFALKRASSAESRDCRDRLARGIKRIAAGRLLTGNIDGHADRIRADHRFAQA